MLREEGNRVIKAVSVTVTSVSCNQETTLWCVYFLVLKCQ